MGRPPSQRPLLSFLVQRAAAAVTASPWSCSRLAALQVLRSDSGVPSASEDETTEEEEEEAAGLDNTGEEGRVGVGSHSKNE